MHRHDICWTADRVDAFELRILGKHTGPEADAFEQLFRTRGTAVECLAHAHDVFEGSEYKMVCEAFRQRAQGLANEIGDSAARQSAKGIYEAIESM